MLTTKEWVGPVAPPAKKGKPMVTIKMTRNTMVDGKVRKSGDVVETADRTAQFVVGMGKATFVDEAEAKAKAEAEAKAKAEAEAKAKAEAEAKAKKAKA